MRVKLEMTFDVSDSDRRNVNHNVGRPGYATHEEVRRYLRGYAYTALETLDEAPEVGDADGTKESDMTKLDEIRAKLIRLSLLPKISGSAYDLKSDIEYILSLLDKRTMALVRIGSKNSCVEPDCRIAGHVAARIAREALADDAAVAPGDATELPPRWLNFGQLHCDRHRQGIPFFIVPSGAKCAECSDNAPASYLYLRIGSPVVAEEE